MDISTPCTALLEKISVVLGSTWAKSLCSNDFFMTFIDYALRVPVVSIVDDQNLFNRGFSFNFAFLVWAVFGGILRYLLEKNLFKILLIIFI